MILRQANSGPVLRGTADGQALVWSASAQEWLPGTAGAGIVDSVVAGTGITVDSTDPANPVVSAPGTTAFGTYAARPAAGNAGRRYVPNDGRIEFVDDGSVWRPLIAGVPGMEPPLLATWTALGSGFTFSDATGTLVATATTGTDQIAALVVAKAATVTAVGHVRFAANNSGSGGPGTGLCVADSVSGKLTTSQVVFEGTADQPFIEIDDWTNPTTPSGQVFVHPLTCMFTAGGVWLRFRDDGTDHFFEYSNNGVDWVLLVSRARAAFVPSGGNQVGWCAQNGNPVVDASANLVSWSSTL